MCYFTLKHKVLYMSEDVKDQLAALGEMRDLMNKSSRFLSLSGLTGVLAGVYALVGAFIAYRKLDYDFSTHRVGVNREDWWFFVIVALLIIIFTLITAIVDSYFRARRNGENILDPAAIQLAWNFAIPLVVGGIFCLYLLKYNIGGLIAPSMLIFYGLALINASKYTYGHVRYLGYVELLLGFLAIQFAYGLLFWSIGFGVMHIIYGIFMYVTYDRGGKRA